MGTSERLKYVFIWGLIHAIVFLLMFIPWSLASIVAIYPIRALYDLVIHYPLVSSCFSALPTGSQGPVPNYLIVEGIIFLLGVFTTWMLATQWQTYKIEQEEHVRERVRRNYR